MVEHRDPGYSQILGQASDHLLRFLVIRGAEIDHIVQRRVTQELRPGKRGHKGYASSAGNRECDPGCERDDYSDKCENLDFLNEPLSDVKRKVGIVSDVQGFKFQLTAVNLPAWFTS